MPMPTHRPASRLAQLAASCLLALPLAAQSLVANVVTTTSGQFSSAVDRFVPLGNVAVFAATGPYGREPWVTDGTPAGTFQRVDLMPNGNSQPDDLVAFGGAVLFVANVPGLCLELWESDRTPAANGPL